MEHCIVYFSTWREPFHEQELVKRVEQSRQSNADDGITSVTLYVRGNIIQVLAGPEAVVEALFQRIEQDQRHTNVCKVLSRSIQQRLFTGSALAYETITERQLEELKAVLDLDDSQQMAIVPSENIILRLIKVFYESNRHN